MLTAGLIGLTRIFDPYEQGTHDDLPPIAHRTGITLTEEHIEQFPERYIRWLIREYSIVKRDVSRMQWSLEQLNRSLGNLDNDSDQKRQLTPKIQDTAKQIRKSINEQVKKVEKYFPKTTEHQNLVLLLQQLDTLSKNKDAYLYADQIQQSVQQYEKIMSTPMINEKLTLNYVKAVILGVFFGQASILQPVFNSKSIEQHIEQLNKDFALPALRELQLYDALNRHSSDSDIVHVLEEYSETYKPFKDWLKLMKKNKMTEEGYDFFKNHVLPCSFIDGVPATQSYEEMTFSPLALSKKNAVNFSWNFDKNLPIPISAIARLIFFAVPAGLAVYNRRLGTEEFNENKRFFGMVMTQNTFTENVKNNNTYRTHRNGGSTLGEVIHGLLEEAKDKAKKIHKQSYFFIELHSEYQAKKTLLDYYHMPPYLASFLSTHGDKLFGIRQTQAKEKILRALLQGLDPKEAIYELLRQAIAPQNLNEAARNIESQRLADSAYQASLARKRILESKKGEMEMTNYDKTIGHVYEQGVKLRKRFIATRFTEDGEGSAHQAGGRKKLDGIAYRLLNTAKAGNASDFLDTVLRMYLSANAASARQNPSGGYLEVPSILVDGYKEGGLDFDTIAITFVAGLLGRSANDNRDSVQSNQSSKGDVKS
ncbi:hypothetical protein D3C74_69670 [compost metagenome]